MTQIIKVDEYGYISRYQNMSYAADNEMYNNLLVKMQAAYCRWYGSVYGLTSGDVTRLKEKIKRGETTYTAWKRDFDDQAYKAITGHTLTEEKTRRKEFEKNYTVLAVPQVKDDEGDGGFLWRAFLFKNGDLNVFDSSDCLFTNRKKAEKYFDTYWNKFE